MQAAGCTRGDIVDSLVYLTDLTAFRPMNDAYRAFFGGGFPARATVESGCSHPDGLVEIMVTAVCKPSERATQTADDAGRRFVSASRRACSATRSGSTAATSATAFLTDTLGPFVEWVQRVPGGRDGTRHAAARRSGWLRDGTAPDDYHTDPIDHTDGMNRVGEAAGRGAGAARSCAATS